MQLKRACAVLLWYGSAPLGPRPALGKSRPQTPPHELCGETPHSAWGGVWAHGRLLAQLHVTISFMNHRRLRVGDGARKATIEGDNH